MSTIMKKLPSNSGKKKNVMVNNENILVERFCRGDGAAFHELVERYKKKVYFIAYDIMGNHHDAEDASQEVFIKMFRTLRTFRQDAKMSSWLYQITVNTCIDSMRRGSSKLNKITDNLEEKEKTKSFSVKGDISPTDPARMTESALMQKHISHALTKVSPKERTVFVMRHYNDLKMKEIAEILNVSVGTVKSLLFRAVKKLQKELSRYLGKSIFEANYE